MKITIEHEKFTASTEDLETAYALLYVLNQTTDGPLEYSNDTIHHFADIGKMISAEISNDKYLTITANAITIGGKSTTEYNGNKIWNSKDCREYVKEASKLFEKEYGASLAELHVVQANNVAGKPIPDTNGKCAWLRCVFDVNSEKKVTPWVFQSAISSVAGCGSNCAYLCGDYVRYSSAFRAGVFGSLDN